MPPRKPAAILDRKCHSGAKVAILKAFSPDDLPVRPFPVRSVADLPAVGIVATTVISDDRDGRGFDSVFSNDRHFLAAAPHFGLQGHDIIR